MDSILNARGVRLTGYQKNLLGAIEKLGQKPVTTEMIVESLGTGIKKSKLDVRLLDLKAKLVVVGHGKRLDLQESWYNRRLTRMWTLVTA